ncbi:IDEAL domain-containing protein [Paenibacillus sp. GCM10027627]|uniref:IDEAL domain-containing protein n=1 Tax=unclassified Paenibacillus TaxID=185978 RepID=UPI003638DC32
MMIKDRSEYNYMLKLETEMILDHILKNEKLKSLRIEIDKSLDEKDEDKFNKLVGEMNKLEDENREELNK